MKVGVIGASGFTGEKLIELLLRHPKVHLSYISFGREGALVYSDLYPKFKKRLDILCATLNVEEAAKKSDILFLALPHKTSFAVVPELLKAGKTVIDLSADYRLKDPEVYKAFYQVEHTDTVNLKKAVYGMPEFFRAKIKKAKLIANPGCYPTAVTLTLAPLVKERLVTDIVVDAKSGITGAGRKAALEYHYAHLNGNMYAYKVFGHQHLPEMRQNLETIGGFKGEFRFVPHVIPVECGIMATVHAKLAKKISKEEILKVYEKYYGKEPFVRLFKDKLPQLKDVCGTNYCDIGVDVDDKYLVAVGVIDNLMKGAASQAVHNMNIICGFDEKEGLL
jgi:N-acetyl-gamma-glutamyl-phosphate reductase